MRLNTIFIILFMAACGTEKDPPKEPEPLPVDPEFEKIAGIVEFNCGECHGFNSANFRTSESEKKIIDREMPPPPRRLTAPDREVLLEYLKG